MILALIIIISVVILFVIFKPSKKPEIPVINSPWGWPKYDENGNIKRDKDGKIIWSNEPFRELEPCTVYMSNQNERLSPSFPLIRDINSLTKVDSKSCVDDDEIALKKVEHVCRGDTIERIRTTGKCITIDGKLVDKLTKEEYYTICTKIPRCKGVLGLISANKLCLSTDSWKMVPCDIRDPNQLFRKVSKEQLFLLVDRRTSKYITVSNGNLVTSDTKGYWISMGSMTVKENYIIAPATFFIDKEIKDINSYIMGLPNRNDTLEQRWKLFSNETPLALYLDGSLTLKPPYLYELGYINEEYASRYEINFIPFALINLNLEKLL